MMDLSLDYVGGSSWMENLRNNLETLEAAISAKGTHTVTAGEETAGTLSIDTGLTAPTGFIVQILRAGAVATSDAALSLSDSDLVVADGSTYAVTENDVINWIAFE